MGFFNSIDWNKDGDFLIRLSELLNKGFPIDVAIAYLAITSKNDQKRYQILLNTLNTGENFSLALEKASFPNFITAPVLYANEHGYFNETLYECGKLLKRKAEQQKALKKTFQYPAVLFSTVIIVFFLLRIFLLPKFALLFKQLSSSENSSSQFSNFLLQQLPIILFGIMLACFLLFLLILRRSKRKEALKRALFFSKIPLVSSFTRIHYSQLFARECGYLLKSGLSIQETFQLFMKKQSNSFFMEIGKHFTTRLELGETFTEASQTIGILEQELVYIIQHGEKNGTLSDELLFYYDFCHSKMLEKTEKLFSYIQPAVFLVIGILIISIYLSILYPMFSMVNQI
ncbi:competence type IV pilus assembly protein ComGB [Listeria fleischmannii]|uniref:Type II secretion system F family protein n=1 Tax=Listeria fleischmannii TaxID=1069827 RepID=A0A841YH99_9LIST|nr:competence type IV pilus assembly protein ComGB [Listeria fleischmannii]EIA20673.1 hypothetical protein KKC_05712 [Listeria fleischmannii subsp. coloradonensis]MBC1399701.1 type II secretion system F family protein [Listeria fleischmannii]MBC1428011.1 type II secretion system F family protein [Listeria fleischmannii]STY34797.1 Cholera toxin secretion protein epsF [Listeria fleischmannii subsp. coloradonensis]